MLWNLRSKQTMSKLYLHIGIEDSSSRYIQEFLKSNTDTISNQGIYTPKLLGSPSRSKLPAIVQNDVASKAFMSTCAAINLPERQAARARWRATFESEIASVRGIYDKCIISAGRLGALETVEVERLKTLLGSLFSSFEILIYFDATNSEVASRHGFGCGVETPALRSHVEAAGTSDETRTISQRWANTFGAEAIKVQRIEPLQTSSERVMQQFAKAVGLKTSDMAFPVGNRSGLQMSRYLSSAHAS